jgi:ribosomal-protein-alanine N-acetyltransferase
MTSIIHSERLDLIPLTPSVLRALLAGDERGAGEMIGVTPPADWGLPRDLLELRLCQLEEAPELQPWLLRGILLRGEGILAGHIGFHTAPGAEYLADLSQDGVEFGYEILAPWRRRGIATEAIKTMMCWAEEMHGVHRFVISISPENLPSLALAAKLGVRKIGYHVDEIDGPEVIFELQVKP